MCEFSPVQFGSCWYTSSISKRRAKARGSITDVQLGRASGSTEVIAARSWRISQRYYQTVCLYFADHVNSTPQE